MTKFDLNMLLRPTVKLLEPYSSARDEFTEHDANYTFMDANESPFESGLNRYPDPQQQTLKTILSKKNKINKENILFGNGSDEVLDLIFRCFCRPNIDNIITIPPTYGMYKVLAGINAIENREVPLTTNFELQSVQILNEVDQKTKLIFVCSPNNPTGNSFKSNDIKTLLIGFKGIVVIDEAYIDFSKKESWLLLLNEYENLIVVQTLSKAYGLAGIRLGVCYASEAIIALLNKIKPPYNVNTLTQQKALDKLLNYDKVKSQITSILKERTKLIRALKEVKFVKKIYQSDANFVLVKVDNANKRYHQLLEQKIVVRNRSYQVLCENTLRFTVGTIEENKLLIQNLNELDL